MEKGVKVVAVNDPFIDPEYMVSSRQRVGWGRVGPGWGAGSGELCGRLPAAMWNFHQGGDYLGMLISPPPPRLGAILSPAGVHV